MKQVLHKFFKLFKNDKPHCVVLRFNEHLQNFDEQDNESSISQKNKKDK